MYFICSTRFTRLLYCLYFCLALSIADLIWVVWRGVSSSHKLYRPYGVAGFFPEIFILTMCIAWHLGYLLSLDSQPCPIWTRWGLAHFFALAVLWVPAMLIRGLPLIVLPLRIFSEDLWINMRNLMSASTRPCLDNLSQFFLLSPSCRQVALSIRPLFSDGVLVGSSWTRGSFLIQRACKFLRDCFAIAISVPASCFSDSRSCCALTQKVSWRNLPFSLTVFNFCWRLSSYSIEEERLRYR